MNPSDGVTSNRTAGDSQGREGVRFPLCFLDRLRMATDGTGVTALVGAYGCPLQCKWCINPQTWRAGTAFTWVTPTQLYEQVKQDHLYYLATGGGVTFGGGEPLSHAPFITAFRALCSAPWHLCAETSLYVPADFVETAAGAVDCFFVDIKDTDPAVYRAYTGQDNRPVLDNLALLLSLVGPDRVTVRLPLIPGFNTEVHRSRSEARLREMGVTRFDRLTYRIKSTGRGGDGSAANKAE